MEIERKFLVGLPLPFDMEQYTKKEIEQSYISSDPTIRLRKEDSNYWLTVKGPGMISREEYELKINQTQYEKLLKKTEPGTIRKTRYLIPLAQNSGLVAELDIYALQLQGLATVEVEFQSLESAEAFIPPSWFGKDISSDVRYKNAYLSQYGLPV